MNDPNKTVEQKKLEYGFTKAPKLSNKLYANEETIKKMEAEEKWKEEHPDGEPMPIQEIYSFNQLKKMNTLKKKDYMDEILNQDKQMQEYLQKAMKKAEVAQNNLYDLEMDIEDLQDDWDSEMEDINKKLYAKAVDIGISKDEYYHKYKFDIFNIKDMEYEKKHQSKGHQHIEGQDCKYCKGQEELKKGGVITVSTKMKVNPGILANTRNFGQKGIRYDQSHLLNYKGVAQENVKSKDHEWKNTGHNEMYRLAEADKYQKPVVVKKAPPRRIDPNDKASMDRLLKLSAPRAADKHKPVIHNKAAKTIEHRKNFTSTGSRGQSVGRIRNTSISQSMNVQKGGLKATSSIGRFIQPKANLQGGRNQFLRPQSSSSANILKKPVTPARTPITVRPNLQNRRLFIANNGSLAAPAANKLRPHTGIPSTTNKTTTANTLGVNLNSSFNKGIRPTSNQSNKRSPRNVIAKRSPRGVKKPQMEVISHKRGSSPNLTGKKPVPVRSGSRQSMTHGGAIKRPNRTLKPMTSHKVIK